MSALGQKVAVVSLGMSCQSGVQIKEKQLELLRELTGDPSLVAKRMPFDWLMCPPPSATKLIKERVIFPDLPGSLSFHHRVYWKDYHTYFWHDFPGVDESHAIERQFEEMSSKYRHVSENFDRLAQIDRRIFILSNTQNNLDMVARVTGNIDITLETNAVNALYAEVERRFPTGSNEFLTVTYADRSQLDEARLTGKLYIAPPDESEWKGRRGNWEGILRSYFTAQR